MSTDIDKVIQGEIDESELTRFDAPPAGMARRKNKTHTLSVRVSADDMAAIEDLADRLDVPISALVRGWVLAGISDQKGTSVPDAVEKLAADVERLRSIVSK